MRFITTNNGLRGGYRKVESSPYSSTNTINNSKGLTGM